MKYFPTSKIIFYALLGSLILLSSCGGGQQAERFPNAPVIIVTVDTLRSDRLSIYGYDKGETPGFEAFAKDAILFERAYAHAPMTLPSHSSLFTGKMPPNHGVRENVGFKLSAEEKTLAEVLKENGYATGAAVSSMVLRKSTGISQGFDFYDDIFDFGTRKNVKSYQERNGIKTIERSLPWLDEKKNDKLFFWLHLYDPHTPYHAPEPFHSKFKDPYDGEIAYSDDLLRGFFDFLKAKKIYDSAMIIVLSDHGEGLGEHGESEHGIFTYRESIQVPFLIKLPGNKRGGERIQTPVGLSDILPTVLDTLQLPPQPCEGEALFSDKKLDPERQIYSEAMTASLHYGWHASRSVIVEDLHYMEGHEPELFDLAKDFHEKQNLYGNRKIPEDATSLMDAMAGGKEETTAISEADKALLESLGYTGGFNASDTAKALSAEEFMQAYDMITTSQRLINDGKYAEAETLLSRELATYPAMLDFRIMLGHVLNLEKKFEQAEYLYMEGIATSPTHQGLLLGLVTAQLGLGKFEEADKIAQKAMEIAPVFCGRKLIFMFFEAGRFEQAASYAQAMKNEDPEFAFVYYILAEMAKPEPLEDAKGFLKDAVAQYADKFKKAELVSTLFYMGDSMARMGSYENALIIFQQGMQMDPANGDIRCGLSKLHASMKQTKQAIEVLDQWVYNYPTKANYLKAAATMEEIGIQKAADFYRAEAAKKQ